MTVSELVPLYYLSVKFDHSTFVRNDDIWSFADPENAFPKSVQYETNFQAHIMLENGEFHIPDLPHEKTRVTLSVDATDRGIPLTGFLDRARFTAVEPTKYTTIHVGYIKTLGSVRTYVDAGKSFTFRGNNFTAGCCLELQLSGHHATHISLDYSLTRPLAYEANEMMIDLAPEETMSESVYRVSAAAARGIQNRATRAAAANCSLQ